MLENWWCSESVEKSHYPIFASSAPPRPHESPHLKFGEGEEGLHEFRPSTPRPLLLVILRLLHLLFLRTPHQHPPCPDRPVTLQDGSAIW